MGSTYITENRRPFEPKSSRTTTVFRQTHRKKCVHQQNGRMTGLNRIHGGCNYVTADMMIMRTAIDF